MHSKIIKLTNFSHAVYSQSTCLRPDTEQQLTDYIANNSQQAILVRGSGLSYNDSCFNSDGFIIDSQRLNHLISFDPVSGIVVCQGGVIFKDLFLLHPDFIPPVLPGTVYATVAGGIAHDVHGKNNPQEGSFGRHVVWFDLLLGTEKIRCSREEQSNLFYATIAGLGLTGIITRVALRMKKASRSVQVEHKQFESLPALIEAMTMDGVNHDYQVAWIDLLNRVPRAILSTADHCDSVVVKERTTHTVPCVPFGLIQSWNMKLFNKLFFNSRQTAETLSLEQFNNPLDKLRNWNRLYGPKGLIQFQAVFSQDALEPLLALIRQHKATPTLAVLKLFTQPGEGLLSFCKPGFTLAVDFINNKQAKAAISAMNQWVAENGGQVYLAKDWLLNAEQFRAMYDQSAPFSQILKSNMHSDLAQRLGLLK